LVILVVRTGTGESNFTSWGWRIPFLLSVVLVGVSVWIRMMLSESPVFQKMHAEGKTSKAPIKEAFGQWKNVRLMLIALFGVTAGEAVVWYT
ncbi:MFS transporter, partial [Halomonas sp. SIMBA_159]